MNSVPCCEHLGGNGFVLVSGTDVLPQIGVGIISTVLAQGIVHIQRIYSQLHRSVDIAIITVKVQLQHNAVAAWSALSISGGDGILMGEVFDILHYCKLSYKIAGQTTIGFGVIYRAQIRR